MKKHLKKFKVLYIIVGIIVLIVAGFVLANTMPKNLGVGYTKADLNSVNTKLGITYNSLQSSNIPTQSLKIEGSKPLNTQVTQSELTALLNQPSKQWKNYPVKNVQFKINNDGTVEVTGKILASRVNDYAKATNMPTKYTDLVADKINLVPVNPSFDYKGTYEIQNGKVVGDLTELKVGQLAVPKDWTDSNKDFITGFVEDRINSAGMKVDNAKFVDGKLDIQGTIPESISFEK
jgi:hypothetical protein